MFKQGDKVIIVGDFYTYSRHNILRNKIYEIAGTYDCSDGESYFYFKDLNGFHINSRNSYNFMNLKDYRKKKLEKLLYESNK
jgi:hypothetical protein